MLAGIESELEELRRRGLHRYPSAAAGIDFASNDYLGLACHPALRAAMIRALEAGPIGATASRLLRGHSPLHAALEDFAAQFFGVQNTLFFGSGFLANLALFSALLGPHDAVVFDERIHASVKEGMHASNAKRFRARHNEIQSFEDELRRARNHGVRRLLIAVKSVYSMDGDMAPLGDLAQLAQMHDAVLVIDEAHATGIFGPRGRGCFEGLDPHRSICVHTCGKALGVAGALVCASGSVIDYLINRARPFMYSTAPSPSLAAAVMRALQLVDEEPWRRKRVLALARFAHDALSPQTRFGGTQIVPVILGDAGRAVSVSAALQQAGFDVRAVRPPTVPEGTARLRVSIHADHSENRIAELADVLHSTLKAA